MKNLDHFLITRFNLKKEDWRKDKNSEEVLNEKWLTNRIELFKNFCLPSVLGQTTKKFTWLIFFEENSGSEIQRLTEEIKSYPFIEPLRVNGYTEFQIRLSGLIEERVSKDSKFVLTTRLDNDDALNKDFMFELQKSVNIPIHNKVLHFPRGLFLDLRNNNRLASSYYPLNQFVSLLENREKELKTVFCTEHDKWDSEFMIYPVDLKDAWLQVTHSKNMANRFKGDLVFSSRLKSVPVKKLSFGIEYNLNVLYYRLKKQILKNYRKAV
ncbi:glycosyltransferase [Salinimicrobium sp. HB62]|uniref:glycosyltransferase n=1 Tax=Salinimicrobium sp. HB62 TaxID=3077781 RepID=UPI002D784119|nr:glycosyltransferase [Salinimicrobium sp. HB62]